MSSPRLVGGLTAFQTECAQAVAELLRLSGLHYQSEKVQGEREVYLVFSVAREGEDDLRIYVYEDEAGYFLGDDWKIWEAPDHSSVKDLMNAFLEGLGAELHVT